MPSRFPIAALAVAALLAAAPGARAEGARIESATVYEGLCDASGVVALPEGSFGVRFLMVNNDDSFGSVFAVGDAAGPRPGLP
ncbi:MAG: hypothetical protein J0H08_07115, partial [Rhizobiales bacterium]|nr:hypothetical protein [Hyphomicrobiales bacterium]